ncbi:hypothetical protein [Rhizobium sp. SU303]|uniref:hypothetical protein n=1 Tax=Rhizobium sp. SU303 TaxID=3138065 RepID=UPI001E30E5CC|nr:hypothetical protein [Rhizobium leguminosarum]UFW79985.1 hypothetical protein RlegSU303_08730 [Rhizobium leguminosarum bv. viciae]
MRRNAYLGISLAALAGIFGIHAPVVTTAPKQSAVLSAVPTISKPPKRRRSTNRGRPSNGKREIARRLRQIAAGQLTRSNGLVTAAELKGYRAAA